MNKTNNNVKFYTFIKILSKYSDENVSLSTSDINTFMKEYIGAEIDRRTIYRYINDMDELGFHISRYDNEDKGYKLIGHRLEEYEIKIIADAIASSRFITKKKTEELIDKILKFRAIYSKRDVDRTIFIDSRCKSINEEIFINVDKINRAIINKKKITFNYYDYNYKKKLLPRLDNESKVKLYKVNPVSIILKNENYYLILFGDKHSNLSNYRIDRMKNIKIIDEDLKNIDCIDECKYGFNPVIYSKKSFKMFPGIESEVTIKFNKKLLNFMIDSFGEDIIININDVDSYSGRFMANIGEGLVRWVLQLGSDGVVVKPEYLINLVKEEIVKLNNIY
ncbi:helix-turn-helix transcriptional regulator [Romboutsia lituseburensis]|uniref:helix-turn-helix transcriptional regulator n=1 Tax=Romboutsia lituseburensis TaxID=1537 RepID=UPI00215A2782|nr:WYL domain-containing protein [Romboutsia lituseburensis]MCR8746231.1 WYL domain-containing protein [Romboutsia lituseburensis]